MKIFIKIITIIIVFVTTTSNSYAVMSVDETETTSTFTDGLAKIVSTDMLLKLISALLIMVITFLIAKIVRNKVFVYLEGKL